MNITKEQLDTRICNVEKNAGNTQTYREFIVDSENDFDLEIKDLDNMSDEELNKYINFLDYLWTK